MQESTNSDVEKSLFEMSGLDFLLALLTGKYDSGDATNHAVALREGWQVIVVLTTLLAAFIGCFFVFWKRFSGQKPVKAPEALKPLVVHEDPEVDADPGKKKVTILFGTQTGTAEGFAK